MTKEDKDLKYLEQRMLKPVRQSHAAVPKTRPRGWKKEYDDRAVRMAEARAKGLLPA